MKRVTQKKGKAEFAAKFICARGKRKALALREMDLLAQLDHERILYFHDAFEKKNVVVIITEMYPFSATLFVRTAIGDAGAFATNMFRSSLQCGFDAHPRCQTKVHLSASQ